MQQYLQQDIQFLQGVGPKRAELLRQELNINTFEDLLTYLLGPVLGFLLHLRGVPCLHGSAVAVEEGAVAFLGPAGSGKSTTAALFARHGHGVFSDDIVPVHEKDEPFLVHPGYNYLRLWPESGRMLFGAAETLPRITPTWGKRLSTGGASGRDTGTASSTTWIVTTSRA